MKLRVSLVFAGIVFAFAAHAQFVINEVLYDTPGTDAHVFTELKGTPGADITGWRLVGINSNMGTSQGAYDSVTLSGVVPASGYFVVAQDNGVVNYNQLGCPDWQNAASASGGVGDCILLKNPAGTVVDAVGYGPFSDPGALWMGEPLSTRTASAPDPFDGSSIARIPDGTDTDNNAADFQVHNPPTPGAVNTSNAPTPIDRTLLQIRMNNTNGVPVDSGRYVRIRGVANVPSNLWATGGTLDISIQDGQNAGVTLRGTASTTVAVGDSITCLGYVNFYNGKTQISGPYFQVTNHGPAASGVPSPLLVTTGEIRTNGEQYEGMLIEIRGATLGSNQAWPLTDSVASINLDDGTGIITLRIERGTDLDGWVGHPAAGAIVTSIRGVSGQYDFTGPYMEYYQVSPRAQTDFTMTSAPEARAELANEYKLEAAYPNPFNRSTTLRYSVPNGMTGKLAVYDVAGREVTVLESAASGTKSVVWNGMTAQGSPVAAGVYVARLSGNGFNVSTKVHYLP